MKDMLYLENRLKAIEHTLHFALIFQACHNICFQFISYAKYFSYIS